MSIILLRYTAHMKYTPVQIFGGTLIALGTIGICGLVFFYGVVLFSDAWPLFKDAYDAFRVIFSIPSGLVVMYASFIALCIPFLLATIFGSQLCTQKRYISHTQLVLLLLVWFVAPKRNSRSRTSPIFFTCNTTWPSRSCCPWLGLSIRP